jgi:protein CMS1
VTRDPATDSAGAAIAAAFPGGVEALRAAPSKAGAPHVIVVVQSASRAVEMLRVLGAFGVGKTGKLFGKHKQLADQAAFLKSSPVCCAVGTPARLCKLVEAGALQLGRSSMLVVETTFKDAKKRTLLELHDERRDFVTLMRDGVLKACRKGKLKILLI